VPDASCLLIDELDSSAHFIGALDEFASIAATITRARVEITALAPGDIKSRRLKTAGEELGAIARDTEAATHAIMTAGEHILTLTPSAPVNAEITKIFEACAFQDITGQRVRKVVDALALIELRMSRFAAAMGMGPEAETGAGPGPGAHGPHTEQRKIDALMSASQSDVDLILLSA
jgi:chemotaxis protein CheZ